MNLLALVAMVVGFASAHGGAHKGAHAMNKAMDKKDCIKYEAFTDVPADEMKKIVKAGNATIIDVNSMDSFKDARIPGARHFASNKAEFAKILPADKGAPIIAYCGGKSCTAWQSAARMACEMGYKNIRHFSEGIRGWKKISKG